MRIGVEASSLSQQRTGIEYYVEGLVLGLAAVDRENEYAIFCDPQGAGLRIDNPRFRLEPFTRARWDTLDVCHYPAFFVPPLRSRARVVVTIHDLIVRLRPEDYSPQAVYEFTQGIATAVRRADRIITVSQASRRDLLAHYDVPPDRVVAIPLAARPAFRPVTDRGILRAVRTKYGITQDFLLFVGSLVPRKNLIRLLQAFRCLKDACRGGFPHQLVIVGALGRNHSNASAVYREIAALGLEGEVVVTGYVAEADLPALYSGASVFVYPSLYEGFGLPPLEAMACGTPVVVSRAASLPEVVGDAALLVDPHDVQALAQAIARLLGDGPLRAALRARGLRRARAFSWERVARETLAVYESLR